MRICFNDDYHRQLFTNLLLVKPIKSVVVFQGARSALWCYRFNNWDDQKCFGLRCAKHPSHNLGSEKCSYARQWGWIILFQRRGLSWVWIACISQICMYKPEVTTRRGQDSDWPIYYLPMAYLCPATVMSSKQVIVQQGGTTPLSSKQAIVQQGLSTLFNRVRQSHV